MPTSWIVAITSTRPIPFGVVKRTTLVQFAGSLDDVHDALDQEFENLQRYGIATWTGDYDKNGTWYSITFEAEPTSDGIWVY